MKALLGALALVAGPLGAGLPRVVWTLGEDPRVLHFEELGLTLTLPALDGLSEAGSNRWRGRLGSSQVEIRLETLSNKTFSCAEPGDVLDRGPSHWSSPEHARNAPATRHAIEGPFGHASYAVWERMALHPRDGGAPVGLRFLLGGLLAEVGYWITVEASPPPGPEAEQELFAFLSSGIVYAGTVRDHRWSDADAVERWRRDAPPSSHSKFEKPIRTAHYIVLTDSSGGKNFAAKMEECHAAIRKVYTFDEVSSRLLLPVFLFRTADEYFEFYANIANLPLEQAMRSKGHAWRDYYATWYDAPGDPVHIHEATHQIFSNRLGLGGGGSWFQEGVAEYMSSKRGDRSAVAGLVKKRAHVPLAEFVAIPSLLMSGDPDAPGGDVAGQNYAQAALLIEFVRESKWAKERFPDFLLRIGHLARGEPAAIEAAIEDLYAVDLAGLEERWIEYCTKR